MISMIVAHDLNLGIGQNNNLPWRLPDDLKHFKATTSGKAVIMGRKTFESLGHKPLPHRQNYVISRSSSAWATDEGNLHFCSSLEDAIGQAQGHQQEVFIIGGGQIYSQALPLADRLYITLVQTQIDADVFFPPYDHQAWQLLSQNHHPQDNKHAYAFDILIYQRKENQKDEF